MSHIILLCFNLRLCIRKLYCVLKKIVVYQEFLLCSEKDFSVLENFVVLSKRSFCSRKNCCVLKKIVAFSKRLLCSRKNCCVSEEKLSCVLPLWATVVINLLLRVTKARTLKCDTFCSPTVQLAHEHV